ncbi:hypothetical protein [Rhizobium sp. BR 314]|uniref:hypothetical protein n=1 Tax=Rhizobium sp. BR 314 TaxID=3040013 RepID=UPI0039BF1702
MPVLAIPFVAKFPKTCHSFGQLSVRMGNFVHDGQRRDAFERADFACDHKRDLYSCPGDKELRSRQITCRYEHPVIDWDGWVRSRAGKHDCDAWP